MHFEGCVALLHTLAASKMAKSVWQTTYLPTCPPSAGIFPRQPKNHKKANKGSSAPASFYYVKDIQYLLHEPVLQKLREHKTFAKKLSRAVGRGEWSAAKSLEENSKPKYRLDHIIKERYPAFPDALRDLDDALSLIILFAHLPASEKVPASIIANCTKLAAEWQLYVMRTRSLKKVFLSVKGIYFQAAIKGETVTWLVPYMFTQNIPSDIDFRIMLTFLELYQTLLGFTFYKLYTDINLLYPPKLDSSKDDDAAGIGALLLEETSRTLTIEGKKGTEDSLANGPVEKKVTARDVKKQIRQITHGASTVTASAEAAEVDEGNDSMVVASTSAGVSEFPAPLAGGDAAPAAEEDISGIFEPYFFYLSREVTRPTLEFILRSFGGQVGWDPILGAGSPFAITDPRITHHVIDRPVSASGTSASSTLVLAGQELPGKRAYIQPQWVVDCINQKKLLPTEAYAPGQTLPPHLSPFVDEQRVREQGGYIPTEAGGEEVSEAESDDEVEQEAAAEEGEEFTGFGEEVEGGDASMVIAEEAADDEAAVDEQEEQARPALLAAAANPDDASLMHAAELEAETLHIPYSKFEADLAALRKAAAAGPKKSAASTTEKSTQEANPASILLSNKQRKLFNKMKYGENKRSQEAQQLREKKKVVNKEQAKKGGRK